MGRQGESDRMIKGVPKPSRRILEAQMSWIASFVLFFSTIYVVITLDVLWAIFGITALSLYVLPIVTMRDPFRALPWEMTILLSAPIILHISEGFRTLAENIAWWGNINALAFALALATLGFLLTVELHMYTDVRMNRHFSAFFVVIFTMGVSGLWQVGEFLGDILFGTQNLVSNDHVMREFLWAAVGGAAMGLFYYAYMRVMSEERRMILGFIHLWEVPRWKRS